MKKLKYSQQIKRDYNIYYILFFLLSVIFLSCSTAKKPYTILKFYGESNVNDYTRNLYLISYISDEIHPGAIIVKNGDILSFDEFPAAKSGQMEDSIFIKTDQEKCFVNNKLISVKVGINNNTFRMFDDILKTDMTGLSMITFESPVPDSVLPLLKDIAKIRPDMSVSFGEYVERPDPILKIFSPRTIMVSGTTQGKLDIISQLSKPEVLLIDFSDTVMNLIMPAIPTLKQLIISMEGSPLPEKFMSKNPQVERLTVMASGIFDFSEIKDLKNLKDLAIFNFDTVANQEILETCHSIESFSIYSDYFNFDSSLDNLKNLRWITFSPNINQADFERFIAKHPKLEVVEILDNKDLEITEILLPLKKLYGLILSENPRDSISLNRLKSLKYLSVPKKSIEDEMSLQLLQKSMPNTIIAANEGFCMGSGWLLLLFPMVMALRIIFRRKSNTI